MNEIIDLEEISCSICLEDYNNEYTYKTECNHSFCKSCLDDWLSRGNKKCPLCRQEINEYRDMDKHYKLVIYDRGTINPENRLMVNSVAQRLYIQNVRLKFYSVVSFLIFGVYLFNYVSFVNDYNTMKLEYELCSGNITALQTQLYRQSNR
jgi:hypothetical protein